MTRQRSSWRGTRYHSPGSFFDEAIAPVAVVIDAVLLLQFLDVPEIAFRMRSDAVERVQQRLLETTVHGHVLVLRQILKQRGKALLETDRDVDALDLDPRSEVEQWMPEREHVPVQIVHAVVAQSIFPIRRRNDDVDAVGALKFVQLVGVADGEVHRAPGRAGVALLEEHLDVTELDTGKARRFAPRE